MNLSDLRVPVNLLPQEEQIELHRAIRKSRMEVKQAKSQAKRQTIKKVSKNQKEIRQDPEKIKELLRLLGEDV